MASGENVDGCDATLGKRLVNKYVVLTFVNRFQGAIVVLICVMRESEFKSKVVKSVMWRIAVGKPEAFLRRGHWIDGGDLWQYFSIAALRLWH